MRKLRITEMQRLSVEEYRSSGKTPLVVVLDNVRSLYNVGSVFRTADAFRLEGIYLCGITARPPHTEIHKTALGAEDSVSWEYFERTEDCVERLKSEGYTVFAIEQCEGSTMLGEIRNLLSNAPGNRKYAIVLGNEVKGVGQQIVDMCDGCLEIPQFGTKHSMNVSVTAGIVIWEFSTVCRPPLDAPHAL
ncbi:MAG: RNA methyltransferase [Bacteroidaceae bacterium]|nr:RNA methyltransferase [Bacteroidaceae bacterium]